MKWKAEAGVPADYWFARTLDWIYKVTIREDMVLPQPAVVRVEFEVTTEVSLTREDGRLALQSFLDTASAYYNLYVLYACYDPFRGTVLLDIELYEDEYIFETVTFAAGLCFRWPGNARPCSIGHAALEAGGLQEMKMLSLAPAGIFRLVAATDLEKKWR